MAFSFDAKFFVGFFFFSVLALSVVNCLDMSAILLFCYFAIFFFVFVYDELTLLHELTPIALT